MAEKLQTLIIHDDSIFTGNGNQLCNALVRKAPDPSQADEFELTKLQKRLNTLNGVVVQ